MNLEIDNDVGDEYQWVYVPDLKAPVYRYGTYKNFNNTFQKRRTSSIYLERSFSSHQNLKIDLNKSTSEILSWCKDELGVSSQINSYNSGLIKVGYVKFTRETKKISEDIISFMKLNSIYSTGRYGLWKYMSMEDSIISARRVVSEIFS